LEWVYGSAEDDRDRAGQRLGGAWYSCASRDDDDYPVVDQVGRHFRQPVEVILRSAELDGDVAGFGKAHLAQTFAETRDGSGIPGGCARGEISDQRSCRLLRPRRERPRRRVQR
jgi:hypothetical protein